MSDIDIVVVVNSLKTLDPTRPMREADIRSFFPLFWRSGRTQATKVWNQKGRGKGYLRESRLIPILVRITPPAIVDLLLSASYSMPTR